MSNFFQVVIVGAGPGGLSVAAALIDAGLEPKELLVIDRGVIGQAWLEYPNDTRLISESTKSHDDNMIADVKTSDVFNNIPHPSHRMYQKYLAHVADTKKIPTRQNTQIMKVAFDQVKQEFVLWTRADEEVRTKYLVWATGMYSNPNESLESEGAYTHYARLAYLDELDATEVTIVGGANGASGLVMQLAKPGRVVILVTAHDYIVPEPVDCLWKEHMKFVKELELQGLVKIIENFRVKRIYSQDKHFVLESESGQQLASATRPIMCTGFLPNIELIKEFVAEGQDDRAECLDLDTHHQSKKQPGLYIGGVIGKLEHDQGFIAQFRLFGKKIARSLMQKISTQAA